MLYEVLYYMVFTRHSAGLQYVYEILQIRDYIINAINLTRFLYQICLTDKSDKKIIYMFRTQKRIKNPVKQLGWSYFCKKLHLRSLTRILNMPLE